MRVPLFTVVRETKRKTTQNGSPIFTYTQIGACFPGQCRRASWSKFGNLRGPSLFWSTFSVHRTAGVILQKAALGPSQNELSPSLSVQRPRKGTLSKRIDMPKWHLHPGRCRHQHLTRCEKRPEKRPRRFLKRPTVSKAASWHVPARRKNQQALGGIPVATRP